MLRARRNPSNRRATGRIGASRPLSFVLILPALCGCAEISRVGAEDASRAAAIAAAVGDAAGAACWPQIAATAQAIADAGDHPGILAAIEVNRATRIALAEPACEPVWADALAELLRSAPLPGSFLP